MANTLRRRDDALGVVILERGADACDEEVRRGELKRRQISESGLLYTPAPMSMSAEIIKNGNINKDGGIKDF
jgi:hypothetical protein